MGSVLAVDACSLFDFHQQLKRDHFPVEGNIDYAALLDALREKTGITAFNRMFAFVAIDPNHEGQQKFCGFLRRQGFTVDATDYRDAFVNPNREAPPYQRLSTRLAYLAGLLYQKGEQPPHIVAVTDAFELYHPLRDYAAHRGGQATVAFFGRGMEPRWERAGVTAEDGDPHVGFLSLDDHAQDILGTTLKLSRDRPVDSDGLGSFKI